MPDWMDEAKNLADDHSDIVDKGLDQATQDVENKTGGKFDSQIQGAEQQAEGYMGTGQQGQQGQQDQGQGQQDQSQQDQGQQDQQGGNW
jgi:antitoxin protein of toxin-antitoxin system